MRPLLRIALFSFGAAFLLVACGDDGGEPVASPEQTEAIASLIDAELTEVEQQCMLLGLLDADIDAGAVLDGTVTRQEDAELLAIATSCIEDFATIPGFVQSFIEGAAESGTVLTEAEAICMIRGIDTVDETGLIEACLDVTAESTSGALAYGDDPELDGYWDACQGGNAQICDELYRLAPDGSEYLDFARTCGGVLPDSIGYRCFEELG